MMQLSPLLQLMQTSAATMPVLELVKIGVGIIVCRLLKKIYDLEIAKDLQTKLKNQKTEYDLKTIAGHFWSKGLIWSINSKLTYLERRAEDQNIDGSSTGRHLAEAILQCRVNGAASFKTAYTWLQKELVESLQSLQKSEAARGKVLKSKRWALVVEAAYRQARCLSVKKPHQYLTVLNKIKWCRTMQWMAGIEGADADINVLQRISDLQNQEDNDEDSVLPDLHAAMWRNQDLSPDWRSEDLQRCCMEYDAMKSEYDIYVQKVVEKRFKAAEDKKNGIEDEPATNKSRTEKKLLNEESDLESDFGNDEHETWIAELLESRQYGKKYFQDGMRWKQWSEEKSEEEKKKE